MTKKIVTFQKWEPASVYHFCLKTELINRLYKLLLINFPFDRLIVKALVPTRLQHNPVVKKRRTLCVQIVLHG